MVAYTAALTSPMRCAATRLLGGRVLEDAGEPAASVVEQGARKRWRGSQVTGGAAAIFESERAWRAVVLVSRRISGVAG
ncbi:MAG: hypothetical protein ACR2IK_08410 [Chloroflexota bacterium]